MFFKLCLFAFFLLLEIRRESRRTRSSVLNRIPNSRIRRRRRHSSKTSFSKTATTPYQQKERRTYSQVNVADIVVLCVLLIEKAGFDPH